ncbi:hypothetical protein [uncultured Modestobacter sp.]|uniref:hypothetical protein n=1 Tax=uncultured Modestobacter sp. TaxID=380048 RepID=UPI0026351BC8|nr:hypothetical protein [uncultured Modestobacter sp.]
MTRRGRLPGGAAALLVLLAPACTGCSSPEPEPVVSTAAADPVPTSAAGLEELLVDQVPSGLPRVPDDELDPPAGEKTVDDVARYGTDAERQQEVLTDYGYTRGWERFWRTGDALTSVFLDQFADAGGAGSYAEDLARNDAEYYGGELDRVPEGLPSGCVEMVREEPSVERGLTGPAVFAWCTSGPFTVSVAAVAATEADARAEVAAVVAAQLDRLPST